MKMTYLSEEEEIIEFVKAAKKNFEAYPQNRSFTIGDIKAGCLFALRWGLGDDCIMVFKLDENFEPINFQNVIKK